MGVIFSLGVSSETMINAARLLLVRQRLLKSLLNQHVNHRLAMTRKVASSAAVEVKWVNQHKNRAHAI